MLRYLQLACAVLFWLGVALVVGTMLWLWVTLDQVPADVTDEQDSHLGPVLFAVLATGWGVLPYAVAAWVANLNRSNIVIQGVAVATLLGMILFQAGLYFLGFVAERDALSGLLLIVAPLYMLGGLVPLLGVWGWDYLRRHRGPV
jgi:hypothetical protein